MREPKRYEIPYLQAWRLHNLLSQGQLAEMARVGKNTILRLERPGERGNELTIHKLARAMGIKPEQLLNEEPPERAA